MYLVARNLLLLHPVINKSDHLKLAMLRTLEKGIAHNQGHMMTGDLTTPLFYDERDSK